MKDRIKQYIEIKGITAGELAVMLDVQRSNISHILNGRNKPGAALIEKLLITFPDLNARWLLTGKGNMTEGVEDTNRTVQEPIPLVTTKEKVEKTKKTEPIPEDIKRSVPFAGSSDKVEKLILVYKDGSFAVFYNRDM